MLSSPHAPVTRRRRFAGKPAHVKNPKQYEVLKDKGMSRRGGMASHSGSGNAKQGGTTAQHKAAGRKGGKAAAKKQPPRARRAARAAPLLLRLRSGPVRRPAGTDRLRRVRRRAARH